MWTTNNALASLLANPEDGHKYTQSSGRKVDWICNDCGNNIKNKGIGEVNNSGLACSRCSDGRSYPERLVYSLLVDSGLDVEPQKFFSWSENKRYDFYIARYNTIIEVHGDQHYKEQRGKYGERMSYEFNRQNDKIKHRLANENGISHYLVIDARKSELKFIRKSIEESSLFIVLDINKQSLDWAKYNHISLTSIVKLAADLWNKGYCVKEIQNELQISDTSVTRYLKKAAEANLCDYKVRNGRKYTEEGNKKVIQLCLNGKFIKDWNSLKEAGVSFEDKNGREISSCIKGRAKTAHDFIWKYAKDYYKEVN
jgi:predicted transcriptional regulator